MMAEKASYQFSGAAVHNITLDPAGTTLVTAMGDGSVRFLDLTTGAPGLTTRKESIMSAAGTDGAQWAAFDEAAKFFVVAGTGKGNRLLLVCYVSPHSLLMTSPLS